MMQYSSMQFLINDAIIVYPTAYLMEGKEHLEYSIHDLGSYTGIKITDQENDSWNLDVMMTHKLKRQYQKQFVNIHKKKLAIVFH